MKKRHLFASIFVCAIISITTICAVFVPNMTGVNAQSREEKIKFHYLNVNSIEKSIGGPMGSADCIVIEDNTGSERVITMVDTGYYDSACGDKIVDYCKSLNITRIDHLVLSHPHDDHVGSVPVICDNFDITRCYYTLPKDWSRVRPMEMDWDSKFYSDRAMQALKEKINSNGKGVEMISPDKEGKYYAITENSGFTVYNCLAVVNNNYREPEFNDFSMCIKYTYENVNALFTGDINIGYEYVFTGEVNENGERVAAGSADAIDPIGEIQIFKLAHHGTEGSLSTENLFSIMNPNKKDYLAIITGYRANIGGSVLGRCEKYGYDTRVTHDGDIVVWTDGTNFGFVAE